MKTNLRIQDPTTSWEYFRWPQFANWKDPASTVVIIPVYGFSNWRDDWPLDVEELLGSELLMKTLQSHPSKEKFVSIPPLRFNLGPYKTSAFATDPETTHQFIEEVAQSIHRSGFRKILFFNSSPWNEHLVDAAGRDLRILLGLQPFCINLSSLGFDWKAEENQDLEAIIGTLKESQETGVEPAGHETMKEATEHLSALLSEVLAFRTLPNDGKVPTKTYPS